MVYIYKKKSKILYKNLIERNPEIMLGKPIVKRTRITVELIIHKLSGGYTFDDILEMYPYLNRLQILAGLE
jgi:uncharacterized protein (DUF433 family)